MQHHDEDHFGSVGGKGPQGTKGNQGNLQRDKGKTGLRQDHGGDQGGMPGRDINR